MSPASHDFGPGWKTLAGIAVALLVLAGVVWLDANRLPVQQTVGVGPAAAMRLIAALVAVLGLAHLASAWRQYLRTAEGPRTPDLGTVHVAGLAWVLGGLAGLAAMVGLGGGFVIGATGLFVATARAFGQAVGPRSIGIGLVLTVAVFLFFSRVLSLSLPAGPLERWLLG